MRLYQKNSKTLSFCKTANGKTCLSVSPENNDYKNLRLLVEVFEEALEESRKLKCLLN